MTKVTQNRNTGNNGDISDHHICSKTEGLLNWHSSNEKTK
uniref:Uncharacterized protein n=1 Tax=Rhizophora mucronata TaxID=61149 RepID=A0A2P2QD89_RHIMU